MEMILQSDGQSMKRSYRGSIFLEMPVQFSGTFKGDTETDF